LIILIKKYGESEIIEKIVSTKLETKVFVLLFAIVASFSLAYYAGFVAQVTIVYTHLFYIPILLAGMWYKRKAVAVALFLGIVHILVTFFSPSPLTTNEFARAAIFVIVAYVIGYVSEQRAKRELELSESEEKYRTLADNITVGVFRTTIGPNGRFIEVNPAHIKIFGYESREEFLALNVADLYQKPDDRKKFNEKVLRDGFVRDEELQLKKKAGPPFFGSVSAVVVKDKQGKPKYYDGIIEDITERKRADDERDHLLNEIKTKNKELERFTYTVSHDLRSPLVTIQGFISMLQKDLEQNEREKAETDLKYIAKAATMMDTLLSDTLQLSRIGRVANPPEDVPFGEIVQGALEQTAEQIKSSGAEISVAENLPSVHVDRMRIAEVLVNLIGNSIKYMRESASPKIAIGHCRKGKEAVFFVKDNGIGIDKSQHEKVFELFYKLDKNSEGTGAGLAIVKRIIEVHGGHIWIESEKGTGCTVYFTLPVVRV